MTEVEHNVSWGSVEEQVVYTDIQLMDRPVKLEEEYDTLPTIVVESNQLGGTHGSDAPIVIYPNDPSVVGAEEVVMEEQVVDMQWSLPPEAEEEVVVPASSDRSGDERGGLPPEEIGEIPLNDETYATYHPFPCDFCCRRFKKKANLINHMVAHQTQRPHCCNICSSRFMRKCDLVNHQKIHSYVPNRDNRDDLDDEKLYQYSTSHSKRPEKRTGRGRRRSSAGSARKAPSRKKFSPDPSPSPSSSPDRSSGRGFKPTSYVDEDVRLLLEMTTKLHESRKSEGSDSIVPPSDSPEPRKSSGTADKPYVCSKCNRCFARESALVSHSQVHAEDSCYNCNKCGSRFFTIELLREHFTKKHQSQYTGETSDDQDDENRTDKGSYTGDERFGTFYCNVCATSFHRLDLLKQHKRILHSRGDEYGGLYRCGTCHSMFLTNEKLLEHLEASLGCQQHVCLLCGEQFSDQTAVHTHIKSKHGRDMPPHTCTYCGKQCRAPQTLKKHVWIHLNDRRYSCKRVDCQKKFHSWGKLKRHMLSHNASKQVQCEDCDEEFPDRRALLNHRHSHYPNTTQRRFVCNECGKSFGSRSSQQIHNRIHTGERPYGCRYCWKAFADGGTLRKHERIHTGEKPYVCAVCPRAFNQRVVLREHIRSHHSGSVSKTGFPSPVFLCQVCGIYASGSEDLALHLVKHSDENTLRNRIPIAGVRPYKRRRKTESTSQYYAVSEFEEADFFDNNSETESVESEKQPAVKRGRGRRPNSSNNYAKFTKTMDAAMKNLNSLVEPPIRKAKMINTKLQPNSGKLGRRGVKKRGRRAVEVSSVVTVVSKPRVRTLSGRLSGRRDSSGEYPETVEKIDELTEDQPRRMGRPRTKNVNYETLRALSKGLPPATFPNVKDEVIEEVVKEKIKEEHEDIDEDEDEQVCGICSQTFTSKADLLFHVPVHI